MIKENAGEGENQLKAENQSVLLKNLTEKLIKGNGLTKSCFHDISINSKNLTKIKKGVSQNSLFSCGCSEFKQSKMEVTSKIVDVSITPESPTVDFKKKKKKQIESEKYLPTYEKLSLSRHM